MAQGLRPYQTDQEEGSFSQDRQTKLIKTVNYKSMGSQDGQIQWFRTVNYLRMGCVSENMVCGSF